jgi:pimeloyl-ACP methyl ester carboxylesterase
MMSNGTNTPFGQLQQIDAGLLNVGYAEAGKSDGPAVVLLHGWPYDIHSYGEVAPRLSSAGYRVIIPYLRGYGTTRFLSSDTLRNGQQAVVAVDILALLDALQIERANLTGFDWGARTAEVIAAIFPQCCKALVSVSGYLIGSNGDLAPAGLSEQEQAAYEQLKARGVAGYTVEHATRRQTIGQSLADTSVGLVVWLLDHNTRSYEKMATPSRGTPKAS